MIHNKKLLFSLLVVLVLVSSRGQRLQQNAEERQENSVPILDSANRSIAQEYTLHDPVTVNNDVELAAVAISGMGSANDPFIIAGWNIIGSPIDGIYITGTTKHFRIENCWIDSANDHGIFVDNVATGTTTITNNICNDNIEFGIRLYNSSSSTITNNTCNSNDWGGIYLYRSDYSTVTNNTCNDNGEADYGSGTGIYLRSSGSSTIVNNSFFNDGLQLDAASKEDLLSYTVENNTVNELPLGYFENLTDSTITETYGQLKLVNCNNTIVKNQNCSNISVGIALYYCHENQLVNNTCDNSGCGIFLSDSNSSTLTNNTCNNNYYGIVLESSGSSTLTNNTCNNNNYYGIYLRDSGFSTIVNNTCNDNGEGDIFPSDTSTSEIETSSSSSPAFTHGVFLIVLGLFFFVKRRNKSV